VLEVYSSSYERLFKFLIVDILKYTEEAVIILLDRSVHAGELAGVVSFQSVCKT
jgi:hypothetical protein